MKEFVEIHNEKSKRIRLFYLLFAGMFLFLICGLGFRQLIKNDDYLAEEERQSQRRIVQPAPRGEIFDRDGRLLVGNRPIFSASIYLEALRQEFRKEYFKRVRIMRAAGLNVNRDKLRDEARAIVLQNYIDPINKILGRDEKVNTKELSRHFQQHLLLPLTVLKDLTVEDYARLTEQLPVESPIQVLVDNARYYPYGTLAAHVLGYVGWSKDVSQEGLSTKKLKTFTHVGKIGKKGLEYAFDKQLQGQCGEEIWLVDPVGFTCNNIDKKLPQKGAPIFTSIDIDIQRAAENTLGGRRGAVVAIEIKTGEVLAMASSPTFDLNQLTPFIPQKVYDDINERGAWINRATQGFYPPASPFKIITAIAALRSGLLKRDEFFDCGSGFLVGNRIFPEHENRVFGIVDLKKAIQVSSNVYFYPLALKMGPEVIGAEAKSFGLNEKTGIEIPFEGRRMIVPDPDWKMNTLGESWRGGDSANMCIGQGFLSCSPLQMACFAAALARKETRIQPTLIHDTKNTGKHPKSQPIGIADEDYEAIIEGMKICADAGSAKHAKVNGMSLAAKTGTAQAMLNGKYVVAPIFFGFAPVEDPQIALFVLIEGDDRSLWGGTTAGPIAHVVLSAYYEKYVKPKEESAEAIAISSNHI